METHSHIINLFIEFIFKHKRIFLGGYVKQITKSILRDLMVLLLSLYKLLTHISFVSSSRMLVKKESISRPAIYKLGSFLQISAAKWNEPVTVYLFSAKGVKKKKKPGSKTFASLQVAISIADKIGQKGHLNFGTFWWLSDIILSFDSHRLI